MVLTYAQSIEKYGSDHRLKKEIEKGRLFQKEKGIYTLDEECSELEIISVKYSNAVFTGESAFYYNGLTDVIPDYYYLATKRNATRITDKRVVQSFIKESVFDLGITQMKYNNVEINIYSLERMLIELVRFRNKMPFDLYKEIIHSYRARVERMDIAKVEEYAEHFSGGHKIMDIIQMEVL